MKIFRVLAVFMIAGLFIVGCSDELRTPDQDLSQQEMMLKGGDLVGAHYNLNIIGVKNVKDAEMNNSNGHVIFVGLGDKDGDAATTRIYLEEGDFKVLDANGTDGEARFQLPAPGYDAYVVGEKDVVMSDYSIFVRPLGKPGGWSTITTCADLVNVEGLFSMLPKADQKTVKNAIDDVTGAYCSVEQVGADVTMRTKGKTAWTNVTAELTSIVFKVEIWIDSNENGEVDDGEVSVSFVRVPIFDDLIADEYWKYDNNGLKLLQVRFYPFGTNVAGADNPANW